MITQTQTQYRYGAFPVPQFTASGLAGDPYWKASRGAFDNFGALITNYAPVNQSDDVLISLYAVILPAWTNISGGITSSNGGGTLTKSAADGWGTGATSMETGDADFNCMARTVALETDKSRMMSLQWGTLVYDAQDANCDVAIVLGTVNHAAIWEAGVQILTVGYETGDAFEIWIQKVGLLWKVTYAQIRALDGSTAILRSVTIPDPSAAPKMVAALFHDGSTLQGLYFWQGASFLETTTLEVYGTFPVGRENWRIESDQKEKVEVSTAEDEGAKFGVKLQPATTGASVGLSDSLFVASWPITCGPLTREQFEECQNFLFWHGESRPFFFQDLGLEELTLVRCNSAFRRSVHGGQHFLSLNVVQHIADVHVGATALPPLYGQALFG